MLTIIKEKYLGFLSWMVLILSVVTTYSNLTDEGFGMFLNSDTLGIPDLYNDVVNGDGKIKDWVIAASTQVFPDALLYTLIEKIFQLGIIKTAFVYGLIQVIIVTVLMIRLYTKLVVDDLKKYAWLIPVFMSMFFLESFYFSKDSFLSFLPTSYIYHFGVLINMLIVLLLYFSSYSKIKKYSLIFLFSAIAGFSDKLLLVLLIAPFFLTLMVFVKKETIKDTLFVMGTIIIGTIIGFYIYGYIKVNKLATFQEVRMYFTKKDIILSVNMFYEQMVTYIKTGGFRSFQLVFTFLAIVGSVLYYFKNKKSGNYKQLFLMVFFVFFSACTICAPFVNGSYTGYDTLRYNVAPYSFASIIFAFFIGPLIQQKYTIKNTESMNDEPQVINYEKGVEVVPQNKTKKVRNEPLVKKNITKKKQLVIEEDSESEGEEREEREEREVPDYVPNSPEYNPSSPPYNAVKEAQQDQQDNFEEEES